MNEITFHAVTDRADYDQIDEVQRAAWGLSDLEIFSGHAMHALVHNGSVLLGAYDGPRLVGFVLGILATVHTPTRKDQVAAARLKMYSVMMGVLPAYQGRGVGTQLKLAQREAALKLGLRLITWTYDPLESRNGWLNIGKLGAVCQQYHRDFHGEMGGINAGIPTDRFDVSWWITANRARQRAKNTPRKPLSLASLLGGGAVLLNECRRNNAGLVVPPDSVAPAGQRLVMVEIPASFQAIKQQDMNLARQWRAHSRTMFETLFDRGYLVTDFAWHQEPDRAARSFYVLAQEDG